MLRIRWITLALLPVFFLTLNSTSLALKKEEKERAGPRRERGDRGDRRGGRGRGGRRAMSRGRELSKLTLLGAEPVQSELKLSDEQKATIKQEIESQREAMRELRGGGRDSDASPEERARQREASQAKRAELNKATLTKIEAGLEPTQVKRLNELALQHLGIPALISDYAVKELKLSEKQVSDLKGVIAWQGEERQNLFQAMRGGSRRDDGGGRPDFSSLREKMKSIQSETEKKATAVLSSEQQEQLKALKGEPFELDRRSLMRGRGGRGGFGGGGRGDRDKSKRKRPGLDPE